MSSLDNSSRGTLEQIIDKCIEAIPDLMPSYRNEEVRRKLMYNNENDFVLGLTLGMIYVYFESAFLIGYDRQMNPQERSDVMSLVSQRMPQIREALFKTG